MTIQEVTERTIFLTRTGSHAYGLNTPESDEDFKGVCIPTREYIFGLSRFEQQQFPGEDKTVYDIRKALKLISECNPNMIELLFMPEKHIIKKTEWWDILVDNRALFVSTKCRHTYSGYAMSQLHRIERHRRWFVDPPTQPIRSEFGLPSTYKDIPADQMPAILKLKKEYINDEYRDMAIKESRYATAKREWDGFREWECKRNKKRAALEKSFGYDTKHASHLVRLFKQGKELLETGEMNVDRTGIDKDELLAIKNGEWTYDEVVEYGERMDKEFEELYQTTNIQKVPKFNEINQLCCSIVEDYMRNN